MGILVDYIDTRKKEIFEEPELFVASTKLQYAVDILEGLSKNRKLMPNEKEKEHLRWCGNLIEQVDWNSDAFRNRKEHEENARFCDMCCIATSVRPYFYRELIRIRNPSLLERGFLDRLYFTLKSGGEEIMLTTEELTQARGLIQGISKRLLEEFNRDGYV